MRTRMWRRLLSTVRRGLLIALGLAVIFAFLSASWLVQWQFLSPWVSYGYESSDGGFNDIEVGFKGRTLGHVRGYFESYRAQQGDPKLYLCRTTCRRPWAFWGWGEYLFHPRWRLPYKAATR
jgi:hypothetical protein